MEGTSTTVILRVNRGAMSLQAIAHLLSREAGQGRQKSG